MVQRIAFVLLGVAILSPVFGKIYPFPLPLGVTLISFASAPTKFAQELKFISWLTLPSGIIMALVCWGLARWWLFPIIRSTQS